MIQLNPNKLKQAEANFLSRYPGGFADPEMVKIGKRHPMAKMTTMAHESFSARARKNIGQYSEDMAKIVGRSSMVSMFEKPKFRDFVKRLAPGEQSFMVQAMHDLLHTDNQQAGFEALVELLKTEKDIICGDPTCLQQCWHVVLKCRFEYTKWLCMPNTIHKFIHSQKSLKLPKNTQKYTSF